MKYALFLSFLSGMNVLMAQEGDSLSVLKMDELIISGQYNPQTVNKSIYEVRVINREMIDRQAGNNLADLLNQTLNMNIIPNANTGKSGVQMFGLDSQYFKILVDNIPLINDEGLGNNTDLTQINLDDVQQIEIVEGSMGVEYGANAISGIINIITKKSVQHKWVISPMIQEETVGKEYNWRNQGRHIQSLKVDHNISDRLFANVTYTRNDFMGFWNDYHGKFHLENDGKRGFEWLPKRQHTAKGILRYKHDNYQLFYKLEFFNEGIKRYSNEVLQNYDPATETDQPVGSDAKFKTHRWVHHLNASGRFEDVVNYDFSFSLQQQKRAVEQFQYDLRKDEKFDALSQIYESRKGYYSKGNFSNFIENKTFDFQLGYEFSVMDGYASSLAGTFADPINKKLENYDVFASSEIKLSKKLSLRPGARVLFSPQFDNQVAWSMSAKYLFEKGYELRAILGSSPRLPNYEELYSYFVDVNHNVQGNPNLKPEQGKSAFLHLKKQFDFQPNAALQSKVSAWYIDVKDKIDLVVVEAAPLAYSYRNINAYKTFGFTWTNNIRYNDFTAGMGVTYAGVSQELEAQSNQKADFLYAAQFNVNASYQVPTTKTVFSAFVKYNGPINQFVQRQNELNETVFIKGRQDGFTWFDASIKQRFLQDKLEVTAGARNLMNIKSINTTATNAGAHDAAASTLMLGYGRSYFLKLLYKINI